MAGEELLLKVDITNAYNTISRKACMDGSTAQTRPVLNGGGVQKKKAPTQKKKGTHPDPPC